MAAVNPNKWSLFDIMTFLQSRKWVHQMAMVAKLQC